MLSSRFVHMIESHADQIAAGVLHQLRRDPRTPRIAHLSQTELKDDCQAILLNLGHWLTISPEKEVASRFEQLGRVRRRERVPLEETIHELHVLKDKMLDYIRDQGIAQTSVDLYAEEELEHQIGHFFDSAVYHVVHGYEHAPEPEIVAR